MTSNAAFLICCCYGILDLDGYLTDEPLANIDAHVRSLQKYVNGAE